MSLISVIIPTYNSGKFLAEAIDSVLCQSYKDFEIIIVDDGSVDNTKIVIEKYLKLPVSIKYIYQENKGPSGARNRGITEAKGEFIAFLDADDIWLPDKLELQIKAMSQSNSIGLVCGRYYIIDCSGVIVDELSGINKYSNREELLNDMLIKNVLGGGQNAIVRKECFDKVGLFDETMKVSEDRDLWFRIAKFYDVIILDKLLFKYRIHINNISKNILLSKMGKKCFIRKHHDSYDLIKKMKAYSYIYLDAARVYSGNNKRYLALINAWISITIYPFKIYQDDDKYKIIIKSVLPEITFKLLKKLKINLYNIIL